MKKIGIGVIGLGNFGKFLIQAFQNNSLAEVVAIADTNELNVKEAGDSFLIKRRYLDYELLLKDPLVELVVIATPPFLHYKIAMQALKKNKHIWLEKPPAISIYELENIIKFAKSQRCKAFVDFELRYSPLWLAVNEIVKKQIMGSTQNIRLENFASDEKLGQNHWFWDKKISGGIFIEHNIHFFDLYCNIFGTPKLEFAYSIDRKKNVEDRVLAGLTFPNGVWSTVWHSFTRCGFLEKTATDIMFERGELRVEGWIPAKLSGKALLTENQLVELKKIIPPSGLEINRKPPQNIFSANWQVFTAKAEVKIDWELCGTKQENYISLVNEVLKEVVRAMNDRKYCAAIDLSVAVAPLKIAQKANQMAKTLVIKERP